MVNARKLFILAAGLTLAATLFAQDSSDQQSLGDVARQSHQQKAKVTLDEDNSQPAPPADSGSAASNGQPADASTNAQPAQQEAQASLKEQIATLDQQMTDLKATLKTLQDKVNNSPDTNEDTKQIWRQALIDGQKNIVDMEKAKAELEAKLRENPEQAQQSSDQGAAPSSPDSSKPQQ